jgi:hypothetical protein
LNIYSTDARERETTPKWLAFGSVALALILTTATKSLNLEIPWWVDAPSVMGFYGIIYGHFNKSFWKKKIWGVSLSNIPNLEGTWVGNIYSSNNSGTKIDEIVIYIQQTWTEISIKVDVGTSTSSASMTAVNTLESNDFTLKYEYRNEPNAQSITTMNSHKGLVNLQLSPDKKNLKGIYFTGRGRQTYGDMDFIRISFKQISQYEAKLAYKKISIP